MHRVFLMKLLQRLQNWNKFWDLTAMMLLMTQGKIEGIQDNRQKTQVVFPDSTGKDLTQLIPSMVDKRASHNQ